MTRKKESEKETNTCDLRLETWTVHWPHRTVVCSTVVPTMLYYQYTWRDQFAKALMVGGHWDLTTPHPTQVFVVPTITTVLVPTNSSI